MSCDRSVAVLGDKHSYLSSDKSLSRDSAFLWAKVKIYLSSKSKDPCYMTIARFFMRCAIFQCFWLFAAVCNLGKKLATFSQTFLCLSVWTVCLCKGRNSKNSTRSKSEKNAGSKRYPKREQALCIYCTDTNSRRRRVLQQQVLCLHTSPEL